MGKAECLLCVTLSLIEQGPGMIDCQIERHVDGILVQVFGCGSSGADILW